jgi:hypothetical protein
LGAQLLAVVSAVGWTGEDLDLEVDATTAQCVRDLVEMLHGVLAARDPADGLQVGLVARACAGQERSA